MADQKDIPQLPAFLRPGGGIRTDPIDMEFIVQEIDEDLRGPVIAASLQMVAAIHTAIAQGAKQIAGIIGGGGQTGG